MFNVLYWVFLCRHCGKLVWVTVLSPDFLLILIKSPPCPFVDLMFCKIKLNTVAFENEIKILWKKKILLHDSSTGSDHDSKTFSSTLNWEKQHCKWKSVEPVTKHWGGLKATFLNTVFCPGTKKHAWKCFFLSWLSALQIACSLERTRFLSRVSYKQLLTQPLTTQCVLNYIVSAKL